MIVFSGYGRPPIDQMLQVVREGTPTAVVDKPVERSLTLDVKAIPPMQTRTETGAVVTVGPEDPRHPQHQEWLDMQKFYNQPWFTWTMIGGAVLVLGGVAFFALRK